MEIPIWTKPALVGAGVGAIALAIVGFNWGGWMTESSANKMSSVNSITAVTSALMPYCLQMAKEDPKSVGVLAKFSAANSYKRRGIIEDAGWATPLGAEKPDRALADACQNALAENI